jgi:hypothetical protein
MWLLILIGSLLLTLAFVFIAIVADWPERRRKSMRSYQPGEAADLPLIDSGKPRYVRPNWMGCSRCGYGQRGCYWCWKARNG